MIKGHLNITKEQILDKLSEEELFHYYCPNFKQLDESFKSDLRKEETPSCYITDMGGYLLYKDFGESAKGTNIWGYLMRKYNITYAEAIDKIATDFKLKRGAIDIEVCPTISSLEHQYKRTVIKIKRREWRMVDKAYWYERYAAPKELLDEFKIIPLANFWVNDRLFTAAERSYCYDYYYHNGRLLRKIYQPENKWKWFSNIDNTVVQGIANIPKYHDTMIITKSLKDVVVLRILGYYSVAPNNEQAWIPEAVWEKFKHRYKNMFIFFDNDDAGITNAQIFSNTYGIPYFYLPHEDAVKDISDYVDKYRNVDKAKNLLKNLI